MRRYLFLLLSICCVAGCKSYTVETLPDNRFHFGNSGGFTGEIREYVLLLDNGQVLFDNRTTGEVEKIGRLSKEKLAAVRSEVDQISFRTPAPRPANRNTEVTLYRNGETRQMQWSGQNAPDPNAARCFEELMKEVRIMRGTE